MRDAIDEAFRGQRGRLTARQRAAVRAWQRTDRSYELVQGVLRGAIDPVALSPAEQEHVKALIADLDDAIESVRISRRLMVYRGIRSLCRTFGVERLEDVPAKPDPRKEYTATSIYREVAIDEFTSPAGALLEIELPTGTPALWVAGAGDGRLRRQGEILLRDRLRIVVLAVRHEHDLPVLSVVVIP